MKQLECLMLMLLATSAWGSKSIEGAQNAFKENEKEEAPEFAQGVQKVAEGFYRGRLLVNGITLWAVMEKIKSSGRVGWEQYAKVQASLLGQQLTMKTRGGGGRKKMRA